MSDLVAISFDTEETATQALASIRALEKDGQIGLEDTAVVTKDADGKIHVKNEMSSGTETGAAKRRNTSPVDGERQWRRCSARGRA